MTGLWDDGSASQGIGTEGGESEGSTSSADSSPATGSADDQGDSPGESGGDGPKFDIPPGGETGAGEGGEYCGEVIDVVFVMDVSTTMDEFFTKLEQDIVMVDAALAQLGAGAQPQYGLVVFVDDAKIINDGAPYVDVQALKDDFAYWHEFTASNQQVNDNGTCQQYADLAACLGAGCSWINGCTGSGNQNTTWTENSLDALYLAADEFQWRAIDTTHRIVIHTTDDTFWEGPATQNGVMIQHDYGDVVERLMQQEIRVYSFADTIGGQCECDDVSMGWSTPYMGQAAIPEATDGAVFHINDVLGGQVSLADAIPQSVEESLCDPYPRG